VIAVSCRAAAVRCACVVVTGLLFVSGCGPGTDAKKGATVKGKLLSNGTALESSPEYVPGKPNVRVTLGLIDEKGKGAGSGATCKADGSFELEDLAPGKYRLTVMHFDMGMMAENVGTSKATPGKPAAGPSGQTSGPRSTNDRLKDKFNNENTKITITVKEGQKEIDIGTIDLEKEDTWSK